MHRIIITDKFSNHKILIYWVKDQLSSVDLPRKKYNNDFSRNSESVCLPSTQTFAGSFISAIKIRFYSRHMM